MAASLNPRQLDLLRQIVDGHLASPQEATTVYALRSRGLVTTRSGFGYGSAVATDAGRQLAETGTTPLSSSPPAEAAAPDGAAPDRDVPVSPDALLALLSGSRGRLVVTDPNESTRSAWRRLLHATRSRQAADSDQIVRHHGRNSRDLTVWLETRRSRLHFPSMRRRRPR